MVDPYSQSLPHGDVRFFSPVTFQADRSALWKLDMLLAHRKGV